MPLPAHSKRAIAPSRCGAWPVVVIAALAAAACASAPSSVPTDRSAVGKFSTPITNLEYIDTTMGVGAEAHPGMFVVLNYSGWLYDPFAPDYHGAKFDSSFDRNAAFGFFSTPERTSRVGTRESKG